MGKHISSDKLSDTLTLQWYSDGIYLWDDTRKMNLAMYEKSEREAFIKALHYYQRRLKEIEIEHNALKTNVKNFLAHLKGDDYDT